MSIRAKLIFAIVASMLALALFTAALVRAAGERNVRIAAGQAITAAGQALASAERADVEKLEAVFRVLAAHPGVTEAFAARDRAKLLAAVAPVYATLEEKHDVTHLYFIEPSRTCFLRVHRPERFGDVIQRASLSRAIETKGVTSGKELGPMAAFALRVVGPWYGRDGRILGYVELGEEMDRFLERMKAQTGDDYALVVDRTFAAGWAGGKGREGGDGERALVVETTASGGPLLELGQDLAAVPEGGVLVGEETRGGRIFVRGLLPVTDAEGRRVGGLVVLHDITALQESMLSVRRGMYVALAAAAAALVALLLVLANRLVFHRLDRMVETMERLAARLAGGDYDVVAPRASAADEIGRFEELFGRFLQAVTGLLKELRRDRTG